MNNNTKDFLKQNKVVGIILVVCLVFNVLTMNSFGLRALNEIAALGTIVCAAFLIFRYVKAYKNNANDRKAMDDESKKF